MNKKILFIGLLFLLMISSAFAVPTAPTDADIDSYWKLENNVDSANGQDLTDISITTGTAIINNGYVFGSSSMAYYSNPSFASDHSGSISFWMYYDGTDSYPLSFTDAGTTGNELFIRANANRFDWKGGGFNFQTPVSSLAGSTWYFITVTSDGSTVKVYIDASLQTLTITSGSNTGQWFGDISGADTFNLGGLARATNIPVCDGCKIDELLVTSQVFTQDEIDFLYNSGSPTSAQQYPYSAPPFTPDTLTVNFQNAINFTNISNVVVNYDGTNYTNVTGNQVTINITTAGGNISLLQNFTVYADEHFSKSVLNWNLTNIYEANLTQSYINYSISEIYSGNAINTFNLTIANGTKYETTNGSIFLGLNKGSNTFLIDALGYNSQNVSYTITPLEQSNVTFTDFYNATIELHVVQLQDNNISVNAFEVDFNPNGTNINYPTSNGTLYIPVLEGDNYNFTFSSAGYFTQAYDFTINSTYMNETVNLSLFGGVLFSFYDSDTLALVTDLIYLTVENGTFQQQYQFTGGTQTVTNLTEGQEFNFYYYSGGYETNTYYLTYQNQSTIDLYLISGSDNITYTVKSEADEPLQDVEVTVEKFISGSWTQISSQLTDVTGIAEFSLERGISHRITFNKEGFASKVDINRFSQTEFTVVLESLTDLDFDLGYSSITVVVEPTDSSLNATTQSFSANITSSEGLLEYVLLKLYYNGTLLAQDNTTSNVGAYLNFNYDLSSYNNSFVVLEWTYKIANNTEVTRVTKVYKVTDVFYYEGTLVELRDRLNSVLTIGEKIGLYAVVFFIVLIMVSIFATGLPAVIVALALATLAGWVFGINIVLLLFVTGVVVAFTMAFTGDNI
jgi:hypothetical protein